MTVSITAVDLGHLRIPLDTWAPPPASAGRPRTHVEAIYVRVATSGGVIGWGECFGTSGGMVTAAFDTWIRHLAIGQDPTDQALVARIERLPPHQRLIELGSSPLGTTPAQFRAHIDREVEKWNRLIATSNIKPE